MAFSDVVLATEEAAADAARRYPPIGPWIQAGPTEVSIRAAAIALAAYGGGTIMLPPKQITLTSPLPYLPGITYQGIPPKVLQQNVTAGTWLGDGEWDYVGGTRLVGDGTFAAFEANPTDQASVQSDIGNTQISNGGIYGIGVDNFTYGIHIGAQNIMGMVYGKIDKFFAKNCSQWGVKLVNFQHVAIGEILTCLCQNGQYYGALMPGLTLYPGNLEIGEIFNLIPRDGRDNRKCRGIVFEIGGTNAALNEVLVRRAQCNGFNRANLSTTVTLTSGSTSVSVPDGTNFLPGMVVNFTTTNFGFTLGQAYVIQSVSGNTITIGNGKTTAAISATGSGTLTMNTRGFPNIEVSSLNTGAQLSNSQFFQLDTEGTASCGLWLENITGCTFGLADIPATIVAAHVVGRTVKFSEIRCQNAAVTDFDANSTTSTYYEPAARRISARSRASGSTPSTGSTASTSAAVATTKGRSRTCTTGRATSSTPAPAWAARCSSATLQSPWAAQTPAALCSLGRRSPPTHCRPSSPTPRRRRATSVCTSTSATSARPTSRWRRTALRS